jgi:hypothetical protein
VIARGIVCLVREYRGETEREKKQRDEQSGSRAPSAGEDAEGHATP